MKNRFMSFMLLCAVACSANRAIAQISIDTTDFKAALAPGSSVTKYIDSVTTTINVGTAGASSWDFSALHTMSPTVMSNAAPDTTLWFSSFPDATHAVHALKDTVISGLPAIVSFWQYLTLNTAYYNPGFGASISGLPFPVTVRATNANADTAYMLPLLYGSRWHSAYTSARVMSINGSVAQTIITDHSVSNYVDAYGDLALPGNSVIPALRVRKVDVQTIAGVQKTVLTFLFLSKNGVVVNIATNSIADTSGTINIAGNPIAWNGPVAASPTSVRVDKPVPAAFALQQNYPNPFNPATTIRYSLPAASLVNLCIYNTLGQKIATLVDRQQEAGEYYATWNADAYGSGVYFYSLSAGNFTETRKMLLLK